MVERDLNIDVHETLEGIYSGWSQEEKTSAKEFDLVRQNFRHEEFISKSKGRGRKRKHPEHIELVVNLHNGETHQVDENDSFYKLDNWAMILEDTVPPGTNLKVEFMKRVRKF